MYGEMYDDDEYAVWVECCEAQCASREVSDGCARTIASWWHAPDNGEAALRFVATGEIATPADDVWRGLWTPAEYAALSTAHRLALDMLSTYLLHREDRGPVPGWTRMWVR